MRLKEGDHVALKGFGLTGFTGTIIAISRLGTIRVQLDPGQLRGGNSLVWVRKANIKKHAQVVPTQR